MIETGARLCILGAALVLAVLGVSAQMRTIREIDFSNLSYIGPKDYPVKFTLGSGAKEYVHGKEDGLVLTGVTYHDLTGDGGEEAIVRMSVQTGGSAVPILVFIYEIRNGRPVALWSFISGDRADGGLLEIGGQGGELLLKFGGDVRFTNSRFRSQSLGDPACCPSRYSKIKLRWNGRLFAQIGVTEISPVN